MTRRAYRAGVLTFAVVVCLSAHLLAQTTWTALKGDGFVLRGQISTDKLTAVACDVETAINVLRGPMAGKTPPQVVAVDSERGIREWLPQFNERGRGNPLGAYWRGLYGDHIVVRIDAPPAERLRRVLHEYAHFMTHLTQAEPPPWFDEGISEVWEHATIAAGQIEIGRPVSEHLKRLRSGKNWMPVQEVLSANAIPTRKKSMWQMFYAESWALVHYLMFKEHGGQMALDRLPDPAAMPTDEELRAYVRGAIGGAVTIATIAGEGGCLGQITSDQVSTLDSLRVRAKALADGERPESALPLLQAALLLDPESAETLENIGFVYFRQNRPVEAAPVFDRVIASGNGSHISYYYRVVLAGPVPERTGGGGPIPQVEYLRKALALNPRFGPAVQRLRELTGGKRYLALQPKAVRQ